MSPDATADGGGAREPIARESLLAWATRIARERRRPHLWKLLREVGLPYLAKPGALLRGGVEARTIAAILDVDEEEVRRRLLAPADVEGFETIGGVRVRAKDIVTSTRRFSPTTLGKAGTHRRIWLLRTLPFCPESWELLGDSCARCRTVQRWKRSISVRRCDRCGSDLRTHAAESVDPALRPALSQIAALVDADDPGHPDGLASLPEALRHLDAGAAFEAVLAIARALDTKLPLREPALVSLDHQRRLAENLAGAWRILVAWPNGAAMVFDRCVGSRTALARLRDARRQTDGRASLPEVVDLLAGAMPRKIDDVKVKVAARRLGVTEGDIAEARRAGELSSTVVMRGGRLRDGLEIREIDLLSSIRRDRTGRHAAARFLGVPVYGLEQIVVEGFLPQHEHAWLVQRYGDPVLTRTDVAALVDRVIHSAAPRITNPVPLALAMKAFGGGPKPWATIFAMLIDGSLPHDASLRANGSLDVRVAVDSIRTLRALPVGVGQPAYSQEDALEILNMTSKHGDKLRHLPRSVEMIGRSGAWRLHGPAVDALAAERSSIAELMAAHRLSFKTITRLLRLNGAAPIDLFGYDRLVAPTPLVRSGPDNMQ